MKQTIRKTVYEFKKDNLIRLASFLGVLQFKKIKYYIEETNESIKVVIPEER